MFAPITYSQRPPNDYKVTTLPTCEVSEILKLDRSVGVGVWNFFWLVNPTVDNLPDAGSTWWKGYAPTEGLLQAVMSDVMIDEVLYRRVVSQPHKFADWWYRQDPGVYDVDNILPEGWALTALERAHQADERIRGRVLGKQGNVVTLDFATRRRA